MSDWFSENGNGQDLDVSVWHDTEAFARLMHLVNRGAMVTLSKTSDGGAFGVTITVDGRWRRQYFRHLEELDLWTEEAMAPVGDALDVRAASRVPVQRTRGLRGR